MLSFNLSYNQIEIEEFVTTMTKFNLEKESAFGNLHFKMRVLNLIGNPLHQL